MQLPYEAIDESKTAEKLAYQSKDTIMAISCYMLRANAYYLLGFSDSVAIISEHASKMFLQKNDTLYSLISLKPAISAYMDMGRLDSSKEAINRYERINLLSPINIANYSRRNFDIIKARYFLLRHQFDSAHYYHEQAQSNAITSEDKLHVFRELACYYTQQGIADSALKYSEQFVAMDDTLYRTSIREDLQKMHNLYNYERNERQAEQKGRELSELKSRIISYIFLLLVIVLLATALIMRRKRKMDAEHRQLNKKYTDSLDLYAKIKKDIELLEQTKQANELLIEQLYQEKDENTEIIFKLNSKIEKYAATIKQNKENLKQQEYIIASFQKDRKKPKQWNMEERLFNLPLLTRLHANIAIGKQPSDGQFQEVQEMIEQMLPGFVARIQELYPQINHVNLLFCIFTKLRFINSERAVIFNMSSQAVTNRSAFLYNKLTGKKGGSGDFEEEIQKL